MAEKDASQLEETFYIMLMFILFTKFMVEAYFEKLQPRFGHNTGITILLGMACSYAIYKMAGDDTAILSELQFSETLFFDIILPSIVFPSGFNMRRKKFFRNIKTIMKFGFIATLICFAIYSAALYGVWQAGLVTKWDKKAEKYVVLDLDMFQILSVCSLLCSSDVIAAISMINYNDQPKLFSIIYGEGVFNDIVSIILFNTVQGFKDDFTFTAKTPFLIMGQFFLLAVYSVGIGIIAGVFSSLLFKWFRFLTHSSVTETLLIFIIALATYYLSEVLKLSGMISLLTTGITMAHYTWYNLSP